MTAEVSENHGGVYSAFTVHDAYETSSFIPGFYAEYEDTSEPILRGARPDDVDALTQIELAAYSKVYGHEPDADTVMAVNRKYTERVYLLGESVRVIETPEDGVYGMMVICPTKMNREDFMATDDDMTDNANIRQAYDPYGTNSYIVNLAIRPDKQGSTDSLKLFRDAIDYGIENGINRTFFESRLPNFRRWVTRNHGEVTDEAELDSLAEEYWQSTRLIRGRQRPVDRLLRSYVNLGAEPLKLVKDAWKEDGPSRGYGVLCEYEVPSEEAASKMPPPPTSEDFQTMLAPEEHIAEGEVHVEERSLARRGLDWAVRQKNRLLLGSAVVGMTYSAASGEAGEIIDNAKEHLPYIATLYGGSLAVYGASAAVMVAAAGGRIENWRNLKEEMSTLAGRARDSAVVRWAFRTNATSAVTAAGVAAYGVVETLPPTAWSALAIPAIDIYSTVVTRKWLYDKSQDQAQSQD
jgi:hypothetical protein